MWPFGDNLWCLKACLDLRIRLLSLTCLLCFHLLFHDLIWIVSFFFRDLIWIVIDIIFLHDSIWITSTFLTSMTWNGLLYLFHDLIWIVFVFFHDLIWITYTLPFLPWLDMDYFIRASMTWYGIAFLFFYDLIWTVIFFYLFSLCG